MIRKKSTPDRPPLAAVMGADAHYEGDLRFDGRVRVDGHFSGRIYSEDLLEVGRDGIIEGEADVCRAVVAGEIRGRIRVREHLLLESTAKVNAVMDVGVLEVLHVNGDRLVVEQRVHMVMHGLALLLPDEHRPVSRERPRRSHACGQQRGVSD